MKISYALLAIWFIAWPALHLQAVQQPVAHWQFDQLDVDNKTEDSIGTEDANLVGTIGIQQSQFGYSLSLDGGFARIGEDIERTPLIPTDSPFTISVWINPTTYYASNHSGRQTIYGHFSSSSLDYSAYWLEINNGQLVVGLGNGTSFQTFSNLSGTHTLVAGEWLHWTVVFDGSNLRSYINGEKMGSDRPVTLTGDVPKAGTTGNMRELIGGAFGGTNRTFEGQIDDLRVWHEAISDKEVKKVYLAPYAHWEFEDITNGVILDSSGYGTENDGETSGAASQITGQPGDAIQLLRSSKSHVKIGDDGRAPIIPSDSDFTISVWINPTSYSIRQTIYGHFSSNTLNDAAYWLEIDNGGLVVGLGNGTGTQLYPNLNGSHPLSVGKWVHWTVSFDGGKLRSYINGEKVTNDRDVTLSGAVPQVGASNVRRELIGGAFGGENRNFDGRMDDIRVWQRALNDESVKEVFYESMIDIRDWGDDTNAIEQAIQASSGDGKFLLLDGEFITNAPITLESNTNLYGRNGVLENGSRDVPFESSPMLNVRSNCEVHDVTIDGSNLGVDGIRILNCTDVLLNHCKVMKINRSSRRVFGIVIRQNSNDPPTLPPVTISKNIKIQSCVIQDIQYSGNAPTTTQSCRGIMIVSVPGFSMNNIVIEGCTFSEIRSSNEFKDGDCINITVDQASDENSRDFSILDCDFSAYSKRGIKAQANDVYVYQCKFHDTDLKWPTGSAISFFGSDSMAEDNRLDFSQQNRALATVIGGINSSNNEFRDNTILLSANPVAPSLGKSTGFYVDSRVVGTGGNNIVDNEIQGGLYGLTVNGDTTGDITFQNNVLDVTSLPYKGPNSPLYDVTPNTLPWDSLVTYDVGEDVLYNDRVYRCLHQNLNQVPDTSSDWDFVRDVDW